MSMINLCPAEWCASSSNDPYVSIHQRCCQNRGNRSPFATTAESARSTNRHEGCTNKNLSSIGRKNYAFISRVSLTKYPGTWRYYAGVGSQVDSKKFIFLVLCWKSNTISDDFPRTSGSFSVSLLFIYRSEHRISMECKGNRQFRFGEGDCISSARAQCSAHAITCWSGLPRFYGVQRCEVEEFSRHIKFKFMEAHLEVINIKISDKMICEFRMVSIWMCQLQVGVTINEQYIIFMSCKTIQSTLLIPISCHRFIAKPKTANGYFNSISNISVGHKSVSPPTPIVIHIFNKNPLQS